LIACQSNNQSVGIFSGSLDNIENGTILQLIDLDSGKVYRNIPVQNGKFTINLNLSEPRFFGLASENQKEKSKRKMLWLENSSIKIKGNYDFLINAKVTGSKSNKVYEVYSSIEKKYKDDQSKLNGEGLTKAKNKIINQYRTDLKKFYSTYKQNSVAFFYLSYEIIKYESPFSKAEFAQLFNLLPDYYKNSIKGDFIKEYLSLPESPKVGEKFIDCTQSTIEGKVDSISGNLGKYTIIEFWASTCPPCRVEHIELRKLYNTYHEKGLNIIGISGDTEFNNWSDAIKRDSVVWTNISDLRGWKNKVFMIYGIKELPSLILLDDQGIILDNTLGRKYLPGEIKKLFKY
jgi:peroxiredoxin